MAVTTTARLGLPQWSQGSDAPSRAAFNGALAAIDAKVAVDLGEAGSATLPVADVVAGRYAPTVDGVYRKLHRRTSTGWVQIGGNAWSEQTYLRADAALATGAPARTLSHPSLTNAGAVENWDGSSVRGGRQAIGDVNSGQPGALHVGDTAAAVDLVTRGRIYALTAGAGGRGFVAAAHDATAGPLFAARSAGGSEPWLVDSQGRMRAQAATAFGAAALTANVPFVSAPGTSDLSAGDFYAAAAKPGLRLFRAIGDANPIGLFEQDKITLGRSSWSGGRVDLLAPTINLVGALDVTGNTVLDGLTVGGAATVGSTLGVTGATTLAAMSASSATVSGDASLTGRLRIPSSNPSGTLAGQIRAKPSPDWGALEVYDGSAWRGHFGGSGRKHVWATISTLGHNVETPVVSMDKQTGSGSIVTAEASGWFKFNRPGLWSITAYFYTDIGSEGQVANYVVWEDEFPVGWIMFDRRDRRLNGNSGQLDSTMHWVGHIDSVFAAKRFRLVGFQFASNGGSAYLSCSLGMEYLGA